MSENYNENLKKGIVLVFIANLINLVISLMNGFILPKYLSVETYASIKTYQLYANYIGVLALGYADGLYLKYGGVKMRSIPNREVNISRTNMFLLQSIMTIAFALIGYFVHDKVLIITALTIIPVNIAATFKNILQATGEFKAYSRIMNYGSILTFAATMFLLFVIKTDYDLLYIIVMAAVTFLVWILLEVKLYREYGFKIGAQTSVQNFTENVRSGIVLMLGNFSNIMMTSIDRWFVKFLLPTVNFAFYSFVVSTENLVGIFINPIVTTMYNYICVTSDYNAIRRIKRMCMIFALFIVSGAFVIKFILEVYLTKYLESQYVLFILFSTEILFIVIKGIYVNIYKARKQQSVYLKQLLIAIGLGVGFNIVFYLAFRSNEGIAFATLLSVVCWYVICCFSVDEIKPDAQELVVLGVGIPAFILAGFFLPSIAGFFAYLGVVLLLCIAFMRKDLVGMISMAKTMVMKKLERN
jgi:O-antigen/teichoic acid export membrane protein